MIWKMRNGKSIHTSDMDAQHLRNTLNMIIRNNADNREALQFLLDTILESITPDNTFELNGDMAQLFNDSFDDDDIDELSELDTF